MTKYDDSIGKILILNQPYKPLVCSSCKGNCGFVPKNINPDCVKMVLCWECYTSSLDDNKYKELTKTKRRDV